MSGLCPVYYHIGVALHPHLQHVNSANPHSIVTSLFVACWQTLRVLLPLKVWTKNAQSANTEKKPFLFISLRIMRLTFSYKVIKNRRRLAKSPIE